MSTQRKRELESMWLALLDVAAEQANAEECMPATGEWSPDPAVVAELRMELGVVAMPTERIQ